MRVLSLRFNGRLAVRQQIQLFCTSTHLNGRSRTARRCLATLAFAPGKEVNICTVAVVSCDVVAAKTKGAEPVCVTSGLVYSSIIRLGSVPFPAFWLEHCDDQARPRRYSREVDAERYRRRFDDVTWYSSASHSSTELLGTHEEADSRRSSHRARVSSMQLSVQSLW